ncbi:uncharacterized protein I206_100744 [Kwoniella pini CBS 10737]|uniref:GH18 domain-containing protein n=1 Tax=Kwoniella pini CBS 10737 TaxID=1296096 RepID=A0AAJ8KYK7_9TREE
MRSISISYASLIAVFGTLNVLAIPAPSTLGTTNAASTGFTYTCQSDKSYTDGSGNTVLCQGDTVCKEGVTGAPCVWPDGYGADAGTGAAGAASNTASGSGGTGSNSEKAASSSATENSGSTANAQATGESPKTSDPSSVATSAATTATSDTLNTTASSTGGDSTSKDPQSGGTKFVGYWQNYSNLGGIKADQIKGMTHIILSFIDMTTWTTDNSTFVVSSNGNFDSGTLKSLREMVPEIKVIAGLGGWGLDQAIKTAADGGDDSINTFVANAKGVVEQWGFDGLDLDWEFPTAAEQPAFVQMVQGLKKGIQDVKKDGVLSVALGSRTSQKSPITGNSDIDAMTSETFKSLNEVVDMWNVMTYDYLNRYDTNTTHQSGGMVVEQSLKFYEGVGIDLSKVNIGFLNTAKYFTEVEAGCSTSHPLGCKLGGVNLYETNGQDNSKSGWLTYNPDLDDGLGEIPKAKAKELRPQWDNRPDDSKTAFKDDKAHAWYDEANKVFWSWTSADDNKDVCQEWKSKVGGMFVWSLNQDENGLDGGSHIQALAECVQGS